MLVINVIHRPHSCVGLLVAFLLWKHSGTMKSNTQLSEQIKFRASKACVPSVHCLLQQGPNNFVSGITLLEVVGPGRMKLINKWTKVLCNRQLLFRALYKLYYILGVKKNHWYSAMPLSIALPPYPIIGPFYFSLFIWLHYDVSLIWRLGVRNLQWERTWEMSVYIFIYSLNFFSSLIYLSGKFHDFVFLCRLMVYMYSIFIIHSLVEGHLNCLHFLDILIQQQ